VAKTGFQCASCGKWHDELPLYFACDEPLYVAELSETDRAKYVTTLGDFRELVRDGTRNYFVLGVVEIPILGTNDTFGYGLWTSLSHESYVAARAALAKQAPAGSFFGWVSNRLDGYPDTINLRSRVHMRANTRPWIELEPTDHPLAVEQRNGITLERVHEIVQHALHRPPDPAR